MTQHSAARVFAFCPLPFAFLITIACVNAAPLVFYDIGGDIDFHLVIIKCFSEQLWQGNMYPRWCMNINDGLGAPIPLFYFPLAYYVSGFFYPLTHAGLSMYNVYTLAVLTATLVTAATCYAWLKDMVSPGRAALVTALFLFLPYRMEVMLYRSAYAELWGMALLPLVFKYTRRMLTMPDVIQHIVPLAAVFGLLFITHLPSAAVGALGAGVYLLLLARPLWPPLLAYAASIGWAMLFSFYYILPGLYYKRFMAFAPLFTPGRSQGWPNTFLNANNLLLNQHKILVMIGVTVISLILLSSISIYRRARVSDRFVRREIVAWTALAALALFLLLPVSAPFYAVLGPLKQVVFPWRMQNLFMLAIAFFMGVWMRWFISERKMKTWKADYGILLALLVLTAYFIAALRSPEPEKGMPADAVLAAEAVGAPEYRTQWTDATHFGYSYIFPRHMESKGRTNAEIIRGKGTVAVEHWGWDNMVIQTDSPHGLHMRVNQNYFPIWVARSSDGEPVTLSPETGSGQILMDVPAGKHRVVLSYSLWNETPLLVGAADAISILAGGVWLGLWYRRKNHAVSFDKPKAAC